MNGHGFDVARAAALSVGVTLAASLLCSQIIMRGAGALPIEAISVTLGAMTLIYYAAHRRARALWQQRLAR